MKNIINRWMRSCDENMVIAVAIESSHTRGMGHLFRSILYVEKLEKEHMKYVYLINDDKNSRKVLDARRIEYILVDYNNMNINWEREIIEKYHIDIWINDKFITNETMAKRIKAENVFLVIIDDVGDGELYADLHFVGNVSFTKNDFKCKKLYSGSQYIIMNPEIAKYIKTRENVNRIIVTLGGSDPFSVTNSVVDELLRTDYLFDVLIGPNSRCKEYLEGINDGSFKLFQNVPSAIELFSNYDFAISGGGISPCEMAACGIPSMIIANASHEINTGNKLQELGCSLFLGNFSEWDRNKIWKIKDLDIKRMSQRGICNFKADALENIFNIIFCEYRKWRKENVIL